MLTEPAELQSPAVPVIHEPVHAPDPDLTELRAFRARYRKRFKGGE